MEKLQQLLDKAQQLEQQNDYEKLTTVYRDIAKIYFKAKNKIKEEEYNKKSKEAKTKIVAKQPTLNISIEKELDKIVALPDSESKLKLLEKFVDNHKNYSQGYFELAFTYSNLNYFDKAKLNYEYFIKINDKKDKINLSSAYNNFATLLRNDYFKDYENAKKYYEKAIELNPKYTEAYINFALLLSNEYFKDYETSKKYYEKAIELDPKVNSYYNFANLLLNDYFKDYDTAKKYYEKAIELNPADADTYNNFAILLQNNYFKDYENSKKKFEKAIELNPNNAKAYNNYAILLSNDYFKDYEASKKKL